MNAFDFIPNPHVIATDDFRNYVLIACTFAADEPHKGDPEVTDYWAFHDGDSDVNACVPIGFTLNGVWNWGACLCNFDERKAAEVHRIDKLLPHEVQREFQSWLEKRDTLAKELADARVLMRLMATSVTSDVYAALALRASHLQVELNSLKAA